MLTGMSYIKDEKNVWVLTCHYLFNGTCHFLWQGATVSYTCHATITHNLKPGETKKMVIRPHNLTFHNFNTIINKYHAMNLSF